MAFNINQFKTELKNRKTMPEHSYEFFVYPPPSIIPASLDGGNLLKLRTEIITLPGLTFVNVDGHKPYGFGPTYNIPYGLNLTEIAATHILDGGSRVHRLLEQWASNIIYWKPNTGKGLYSANYLKNYAVDVRIVTYNEDAEVAGIYILREAFPVTLDQVPMSWGATDQYTKINVQWKFTDWHIDTRFSDTRFS